ncbi:dihydroxyacetone kinase subunit DhaK [Phytohabitans sp. ZYX-F-186]|uniref:Dihydroxyacetone kinase subunit DhaK n=1 Tax=Phytohabitans maris TaxID=3071409 RepID=A0ABU0ZW86_9ACTN|nr:dihydroxyacetone kinase subunit DhaK [Phytohabitans sp. ZYX-F-186]MDQ7911296.1 dihydroxyacetone kinase subunit DhaK [Phytohabitans sp. ZYX-F-186]
MAELFFVTKAEYVDRALRGFARDQRDIVRLHTAPAYVRALATNPARRVGLVAGGGSGHEPMHVGLVGAGMLDAAVPGRVFASPHNRQVYEASRSAAGPEGVLHIVKNYTGDRINFGIAAERLRHDGIPVARVLVDDDVATESTQTATGRRGTGATIVVEKLLGAAADRGTGLDALVELGRAVASRSRSIAVASAAHTSHVTGRPGFELAPNHIEYGVGIHGERARQTIPRPPLEDLVERMVDDVLANLPAGTRALVLVNGLGGTTAIELYNVFAEVEEALGRRGVAVAGSLVGTWTPALDMKGFSVTVTMLLPDDGAWTALWDAPVWTATLRKRG